MISRFVFGMGTGRCGTWTLHLIFEAQEGLVSNHEGVPLPWKVDAGMLWYHLILLAVAFDAKIIANTSFAWINYVGLIMGNLIDPKCICLKRDKEEVVESFCKHIPNLNHWTDPDSTHWNPNKDTESFQSISWPKYDLPKKEAIARYWEDYYAHAEYLRKRYPRNFMIIDMDEALNTYEGQKRMLSFAGIPEENQRIFLHQKLNEAGKPKGRLNNVLA